MSLKGNFANNFAKQSVQHIFEKKLTLSIANCSNKKRNTFRPPSIDPSIYKVDHTTLDVIAPLSGHVHIKISIMWSSVEQCGTGRGGGESET